MATDGSDGVELALGPSDQTAAPAGGLHDGAQRAVLFGWVEDTAPLPPRLLLGVWPHLHVADGSAGYQLLTRNRLPPREPHHVVEEFEIVLDHQELFFFCPPCLALTGKNLDNTACPPAFAAAGDA